MGRTEMVAGFRRTISFPAPKSSTSSTATASTHTHRLRSTSLPCRFHPLLLQLDDDVATLRQLCTALTTTSSSNPSPSQISTASDQLSTVLSSLTDILHHPQAQDPLRRGLQNTTLSNRLLDDFLKLADSHGNFRSSLISLSSLHAESRSALRRGDASRLSSAARALRRAARDLSRLATSARAIAKSAPPPPINSPSGETSTLAAAMVDAVSALSSASAAVFSGVATLSVGSTIGFVSTPLWFPIVSPAPATQRSGSMKAMRIWWVADLMRWMRRAKRRSASGSCKKQEVVEVSAAVEAEEEDKDRKMAFKRLDELEECITQVECSGEKVFRALVNTRVSLLNLLTPSF